MRFAEPLGLLALALPALLLWRRARAPRPHVAFSLPGLFDGAPPSPRARWARRLRGLDLLGLVLLALALGRPQWPLGTDEVRLQARNIVVALDISSSMKATDFQPGNRLMVARDVMRRFVEQRDGDLVGLVIFSGRAFLQAPLTHDVRLVGRILDEVDIGQLPDGTAIGTALALALTQLRDLPPAASTVLLLTDGAQNAGTPTLAEATEIARALEVRVHAIGLTAADTSEVELSSVWKVRDRAARLSAGDAATLRRVAERTGGQYAVASDPGALDSIMRAIDPLERTEVVIQETREYRELAGWVALAGALLLALDRLLAAHLLRRTP